MTYRWAVIVLGLIVVAAAMLLPRQVMSKDAPTRRKQILRHNWIATLAFVGLPLLFLLANRIDNPPPPAPPPPRNGSNIEAEMLMPAPRASGARAKPKGVTIEPSGFGTLLAAPATELEPSPNDPPLAGLRSGDPDIAPEIAHLIRILPRVRPSPNSNAPGLSTLEIPPTVTGTIILRDGCFRLSGRGEPLVLLPEYARAVLDESGYLMLGPPGTARDMAGRVGETMSWAGPTLVITNPAVTEPLHKTCGPGRVVRAGTSSVAVGKSAGDAGEARSLSGMYGIPYRQARREVAVCQADADRRRAELRTRFGADASHWPNDRAPGPCRSSPPPPVFNASDCPAGTKLSGGLCRNEGGFIARVLPGPLL